MVGDRLYTDKKLAENCHCDFVAVLTGESCRADMEAEAEAPALIVNHVGELGPLFAGRLPAS